MCLPTFPVPTQLRNVITEYLAILPNKHAWPNFNLGNHDKPRVGKRLGHALVDAFNMIMLLLPGTPVTYYGDEIGMIDYKGTIPSRYNSQGNSEGRLTEEKHRRGIELRNCFSIFLNFVDS